jgi:hypothetical protein
LGLREQGPTTGVAWIHHLGTRCSYGADNIESEARSVTIMVLLVLAAIWAAVLLPPFLQKRRAFHPHASIGDFRNQLAVLQRTGDPYAPARPAPTVGRRMNRTDAQRRRRDVLTTLAAAAALTFVLALVAGGAVWLLHLSVDAALLGYVAMLMQVQQQRPARANVRYLPPQPRPSVTQQALLRRQAN